MAPTASEERSENFKTPQKSAAPGRTGSRTEFSLHEQTMRVEVSDKVKQARKEVQEKYSPDCLGLKPKEWNQTVTICRTKYSIPQSDAKLSNTLKPTNINNHDYRTIAGTTYTFDKEKTKFFDRGEVTTGWNHSTVQDPHERLAAFKTLEDQSKTQTMKRTSQLSNYVSPVRRQEQLIEYVRQTKSELGKDERALEQKYGKEGAEHMRYILSLKSPERKPRLRTTKADLEAVSALPTEEDAPDMAPEESEL